MDKERITISIDGNTLSDLDTLIDGTEIRSRSHAVESLINEALKKRKIRTAIIMAGGRGTRLRPITFDIPKPLIKLGSKTILEHQIEWLSNSGIRNIILAIGYKGEAIKEKFKDGSEYGVQIKYIEEEERLGSGGALRMMKGLIHEPVVLLYGDILCHFDLSKMIETHKNKNRAITVALKTVEDPSRFGVAEIEGNTVTGFVEKPNPKDAPSNLINAGVFVLNPEVDRFFPEEKFFEFFQVLINSSKRGELTGYPFSGAWIDVGVPETLEKAKEIWR
ncbi:MAG: nucleotidyltransferase family protein [Candidatus Diapherotrites archaeon]|nr:nucleotidyltransferase family protein [Candidatus Diapherotrites archaeon]